MSVMSPITSSLVLSLCRFECLIRQASNQVNNQYLLKALKIAYYPTEPGLTCRLCEENAIGLLINRYGLELIQLEFCDYDDLHCPFTQRWLETSPEAILVLSFHILPGINGIQRSRLLFGSQRHTSTISHRRNEVTARDFLTFRLVLICSFFVNFIDTKLSPLLVKHRHSDIMVILYHGTKCSSFQGITTKGLLRSESGRLGPGVYFTTKECAHAIGQHRGDGTGFEVFRVEVDLGRMAELGTRNDDAGSWANTGYTSAHGTHPAWCGLPPFPEWCVRNPASCRILSVEVENGTVTSSSAVQIDAYLSAGSTLIIDGGGIIGNVYGGPQP